MTETRHPQCSTLKQNFNPDQIFSNITVAQHHLPQTPNNLPALSINHTKVNMYTPNALSIISLAAILGSSLPSVLAAPSPPFKAASTLARREVPLTDPTYDTNLCYFNDNLPATQWALIVTGDRPRESGGCGEGILDNLRGRCGVITTWGCQYVGADGSNTALATFWTTNGCSDVDVTDVVLAASSGSVNVPCVPFGEGVGPDASNLLPEIDDIERL